MLHQDYWMRAYQTQESNKRSHAFESYPARTGTNAGTSGKTLIPEKRATKCATSGAVSVPSVDELAEAIARMTPSERARIAAVLAGESPTVGEPSADHEGG